MSDATPSGMLCIHSVYIEQPCSYCKELGALRAEVAAQTKHIATVEDSLLKLLAREDVLIAENAALREALEQAAAQAEWKCKTTLVINLYYDGQSDDAAKAIGDHIRALAQGEK